MHDGTDGKFVQDSIGIPSYQLLVAEAPYWTEIARLILINRRQPTKSIFT